jgi:N-acetylglucosamine-6-phosphate deacetylase
MIIRGARVFGESGFEERDIFIDGERISGEKRGEDTLFASGLFAIPGLIDVHIHGCMGSEFTSAEGDAIRRMARYEASCGVTAICPTTLTLSEEMLTDACCEIARGKTPDGAAIVGIYLEGPFVSPRKLGAQNPNYVRSPDAGLFRRLQNASGGMVKLLAVAPETDGALDMIREIKDEVVCSIAHTTANYDVAARAFSAGARQVTHLYNAMPPFHHRDPGVVGAAFDAADCRVELICDDVHIHPSVVRATFGMFGDDRVVMISDSMMATGLSDGDYELGGLPVRVTGNRATLIEGGAIAGSATNLMGCLKVAVKTMGIPLHSAVKCASVNPAKAVGVWDERGSITAGKYADVVLLDDDLNVKEVILRGKPLNNL